MGYDINMIRNIALAGHSGTGKTSISEAVMFVTKQINRLGNVTEGNTVADYNPEEIKRQISINSTFMSFDWNKAHFNLIDLPGYSDFISEMVTGIYAADHIVTAVSAAAGIQIGTENIWDIAAVNGKKVYVFVNKLDRENTDFERTLDELNQKLVHPRPVVMQLPLGNALDFKGIVDIIKMKAYEFDPEGNAKELEIPAELKAKADDYRERFIESIAEEDESLMEKVLEGGTLTNEEIAAGLETAMRSGNIAPVLIGSAEKLIGISTMLNFFIENTTSPVSEVNYFYKGEGEKEIIKIDPEAPFSAKVFKTVVDPYAGKMNFFKVLSGTLKAGDSVHVSTTGKSERISHVFVATGKKYMMQVRLLRV